MRNVVVRYVSAPDESAVATLAKLGVSTTHEAAGRTGLTEPVLRPIYPGARIAGRAVTVLSHPGDNLMIHAAIEQCSAGDILVVSTTSRSTDGMFGDLFAAALQSRGVRGLVTDAGVRDVATLREMQFPVWSRAVHAQGTVKNTPGSVNVPIAVAGRTVCPGDVVVADDDGVVIVPRLAAPAVATAAEKREALEAEKRKQFESGVLSLDLYGLRAKLESLGVEYIDESELDIGRTP
ncbi:4-carboxy-4-hydroxy-2-oxoadipate aldolase/oxaloacetate decarboxylase [Nocardia fusca]|uniref:4-carboxy-4-hydroxy-2-oxoadipate aldolase/oxaloacetate decarboxylase n=1 Tax=Nocardia fusca TaxID=941183 RepID=UPI00379BF5FF